MKKLVRHIIPLFLVIVFLYQGLGKGFVFADYLINKEFISKTLCINKAKPDLGCEGMCQLKKQLDKQEKNEQSPFNPTKEKNEVQLFSQSSYDVCFFKQLRLHKTTFYYQTNFSDKYSGSVFHPPQV